MPIIRQQLNIRYMNLKLVFCLKFLTNNFYHLKSKLFFIYPNNFFVYYLETIAYFKQQLRNVTKKQHSRIYLN